MRLSGKRTASVAALLLILLVMNSVSASADGVEPPDVTARHAIVVDALTGDILLDKAANQSVPMASLTKLFTAFVAIESTPLDRTMTTSPFDLVGEASMGLSAGEELRFETLLHGMLLPSGNDAATAIARNLGMQAGYTDQQALATFVERMNVRAQELGLNGTHLANPHGLDQNGHYSTARDIAALTVYALDHEPTFAAVIGSPEFEGNGYALLQTNQLLGQYPGLLGGKTGVTDAAGYCLMQIAERNGQRVVVVLLGSTPEQWYADAQALLDYGFAAIAAPASAPAGKISFAPEETLQLVIEPSTLTVTAANDQTAVVTIPEIANAPRRSPWLWIVSALLLTPLSLLALTQLQRVPAARRRSTPRTTKRRARGAVSPVMNRSWETQSFRAVYVTARRDLTSSVAGETMQWHLPFEPRTNRDGVPLRPALTPSIGD